MNKAILTTLVGTCLTASASGQEVFFQGFETDTSGFLTSGGSFGTIARVASGDNGISSFEGGFHGIAGESSDNGPFTQFDGYRDTFGLGYSASVAVYLDPTWNVGSGFEYTVASNGSDDIHQRDFVFSIGVTTDNGLVVAASNNAENNTGATEINQFPLNSAITNGNATTLTTAGWYILEHVFNNDGGVLSVDMNLRDAGGSLVFSETRSDASDLIPSEVGGNRYGWFPTVKLADGVAFDNATLTLVPTPASAAILGLGGLAAVRRRR